MTQDTPTAVRKHGKHRKSVRPRRLFSWVLVLLLAIALGMLTFNPPAVTLQQGDTAGYATESIPSDAVPVIVDEGQVQNVNWFSDWQTCIWGVGVPTAWAMRNPWQFKQMIRNYLRGRGAYNGFVSAYGSYVTAACIRFVNS